MFDELKKILAYREMLISTVKKDLRSRYRGSFLGFLWTFINPLFQLLIYSVVFPFLLRIQTENYPMYVFAGLLPWIYFTSSVQISSTCIVANANLVKKIYFPRMILPISVSCVGLINYFFGLCVTIPALIITGVRITPWIALLPVIMLVQFLFTTGLCLALSALYVRFRDLEHIVGILLTAWFYVTPIVYDAAAFPENIRKILALNPMTQFVDAYRAVMLYGTAPGKLGFPILVALSVAVFFAGAFIFSKLQKDFAEEL